MLTSREKSGRRDVLGAFRTQVSVLAIAALACSSCLPLRFTTSPGASGVVLDSQTRAPIAGAEVVISHSIYPPASVGEAFTNSRPPAVTTETNGQFSIPPERAWDLFVIPIDAFPPFGLLVVRHDGYEPVLVPFWSRQIKPLGELLMHPVASQNGSPK